MMMKMMMNVKLNSDPHNVAGDYKDDDDGDDNDIHYNDRANSNAYNNDKIKIMWRIILIYRTMK